MQVTALAAGNNVDLLAQQIVQFRPKVRACMAWLYLGHGVMHTYMYMCL
jgi:1-deoxy-D-xylulose 5-phosphate reductoisomerase